MAAENIMHELTGRGITLSHSVFTYPNHQGSVYYGSYQNLPVGVKVKHYSDHNPDAPKEYQVWREMQHPNVIRLYDCFWAWNGTWWYLVFVMEWCQWDASQEIAKRKEENRPFREVELWNVAKGLGNALAAMQTRGFSHHNLKVQNIYPFSDAPKIGDFSRSHFVDLSGFKTIDKDASATTVPPFLSPELRYAWAYRLAYSDSNSYKADAYSLGVVLFSLAKLEIPQCFLQVHVPESEVKAGILELGYSEQFKKMLQCLLAENVDYRWDFMQLSVMVDWHFPMENAPAGPGPGPNEQADVQALVHDVSIKLAVQEEAKSDPVSEKKQEVEKDVSSSDLQSNPDPPKAEEPGSLSK